MGKKQSEALLSKFVSEAERTMLSKLGQIISTASRPGLTLVASLANESMVDPAIWRPETKILRGLSNRSRHSGYLKYPSKYVPYIHRMAHIFHIQPCETTRR